jgi:hypothetical protein
MTRGKTLMALSTAIALGLLGAASAVQANDTDGNGTGGYRVGAQGQSSHRANPHHSSMHQGGSAYGLAPGYRSPTRPYPNQGESQFEKNWFGYQDCPGTETQGGC